MKYLECEPPHTETIAAYDTWPQTAHVFEADQVEAVNAALACQRPLLVRGEPGVGKSQLARAAAAMLGRAFLPFTVDARTESRDLLYSVDAVARLAEAQIISHLGEVQEARAQLDPKRFTTPGPLWWVFDWEGAKEQATLGGGLEPWTPEGWTGADGAVLLVDEIDKADPAVPNGLLEALGQGQFRLPDGRVVSRPVEALAPLVVVTTNEERTLPDAFIRRCLVLQLRWPKKRFELIERLVARGRAHFGDLAEEVLQSAAEMVADDREAVEGRGLCPPGGAEYLDLLRVVASRWAGDAAAQKLALGKIRAFALRKHPDEEVGW